MKSLVLTESPLKLPVMGYHFSNPGPEVLLLGGVHGDEIEGVIAAQKLLSLWSDNFPFRLNLLLVPIFNPDGVFHSTRTNSNGVDLNRNLPTKDWSPEIKTPRYNPGPMANSEPENQWLSQWIEIEKPKFILSIHSWHPMLNVNGNCTSEAQAIQALTGYRIDSDIGYPTPGCLGTYAGIERSSPTLTYEIERGLAANRIIDIHVPAMIEALKVTEQKYE